MKCPGCGAEVESDKVAHYHKSGVETPETPATPAATPEVKAETPATPAVVEDGGLDFTTSLFEES